VANRHICQDKDWIKAASLKTWPGKEMRLETVLVPFRIVAFGKVGSGL